jgi:hypothetical protein
MSYHFTLHYRPSQFIILFATNSSDLSGLLQGKCLFIVLGFDLWSYSQFL